MMLLYAVRPAEAETPELVGVCGREIETVRGSEAALIAEECPRAPEPNRSMALRYYEIVDQLSRSAAVLPVRFPTVLSDRAEVGQELARRGSQWRRRLDELHGLAEMVVRASWPDQPTSAPDAEQSVGSAYLRHRAAQVHATEEVVGELVQRARRVCRDVRQLPASEGVRLACLAPRTAEPELRQLLDEWRQEGAGRHVTLGGPWPPFSFVDQQEAAAR
jgi:hypothetical protein